MTAVTLGDDLDRGPDDELDDVLDEGLDDEEATDEDELDEGEGDGESDLYASADDGETGADDEGADDADTDETDADEGASDALADAAAAAATRRERRVHISRRVPEGKAAWDKDRTRELFRRYKEEGDLEARDQLIVSHLNLVRFLAGKYKNRGEPLDDIVQVGTVGLIKAIDRFEPERGLEFTTYATPTITGEIKRHFRDKGWSVRVPRRLQELSSKVNKTTDELTKELQRSPSVDEIADRLGVTVDEVLEAMESSTAYSSIPLEAGGSSDNDEAPSIIDRYASWDKDLAGADDRMTLEQVLDDFSPREQDIIRMRFEEDLTQVEIAERLGVSQVQVSRLLRRTLRKLQEKMES